MTISSSSLANLNGLILSGGKSSRMGKDKGSLIYHKIPQVAHLTNLLKPFCEQVFVSAKHEIDYPNYSMITDQYSIESPLNGILSALTLYPENAWLVIACDMPIIDSESIKYLIGHRTTKKLATCYRNKADQTEPLFCVWEPQTLSKLSDFQAKGEFSPKKFLNTNDVTLIYPLDFNVLTNVNTMEEYKRTNKND